MRGIAVASCSLLVAGCQLVFELRDELDEDLDRASDGVDNCPGLANEDQLDVDGDGVGDACDPDLGLAASCDHRVELFDTFDRDLGDWTPVRGEWTVDDGALVMSTTEEEALIVLDRSFRNATLFTSGTIDELAPDEDNDPPRSHIMSYVAATLESGIATGYSCHVFHFHDTNNMLVHLTRFVDDSPEEFLEQGIGVGQLTEGAAISLRQQVAVDKRCRVETLPPAPAMATATSDDTSFDTGAIGLGGKQARVRFESVMVVTEVEPCGQAAERP